MLDQFGVLQDRPANDDHLSHEVFVNHMFNYFSRTRVRLNSNFIAQIGHHVVTAVEDAKIARLYQCIIDSVCDDLCLAVVTLAYVVSIRVVPIKPQS